MGALYRYRLVLLCLSGIIVLFTISIFIYTQSSKPMESALRWCRLNPLPDNAKVISCVINNRLSWRGYRCRFQATESAIKQWLANSPGIQNSIYDPPADKPHVINNGINGRIVIQPHTSDKYIVSTAEGINWGEVNIHHDIVEIYTYSD